MSKSAILGISAFYHDSAAALVMDGNVIAAAQEERFTRIKQDSGFPHQAVKYCLEHGGIKASELQAVVFYDKPLTKFERILENYFAVAPKGFSSFLQAIPLWLKDKLFMRGLIDRSLGNYEGELLFARHHESHAASAFFASPYAEAAVLTMDGVGEWHSTTWGVGRDNHLDLRQRIDYPHSLGLLYSAITYYTGFKVNSGEYKVMGLAPYGEPKYVQIILDHLIDLREDGSYRLNMKYFNYHNGLRMTSKAFDELMGGPPRKQESEVTQKEMDLARSIQEVINEALLRLGRHIRKESGLSRLCLAGGVALNCVANGVLLREGIFEEIWIQPAAGDAGGALGAALFAHHQLYGGERKVDGIRDRMSGSRLGPEFSIEETKKEFASMGAVYQEFSRDEYYERCADLLAAEKVIGWFDGRMEFGPRALGARSIIGDPRSSKMQSVMNLKIKYRESFRPFAPSVLYEKANEYFDLQNASSPYMLLVCPVRAERHQKMSAEEEQLFGIAKLNVQRSDIPAVTHVDYSARVQTVGQESSAAYQKLLRAFEKKTGCALIVNTSFNVRGEPIVCTPADAYRCFMRTEMDILAVDGLLLFKEDQPPWQEKNDWRKEFELD